MHHRHQKSVTERKEKHLVRHLGVNIHTGHRKFQIDVPKNFGHPTERKFPSPGF